MSIVVYELINLRLQDEQFLLFAFHLFERFKLLNCCYGSPTDSIIVTIHPYTASSSEVFPVLFYQLCYIHRLISNCFGVQLMIAFLRYFVDAAIMIFTVFIFIFEDDADIKYLVSMFIYHSVYEISAVLFICLVNSWILGEVNLHLGGS